MQWCRLSAKEIQYLSNKKIIVATTTSPQIEENKYERIAINVDKHTLVIQSNKQKETYIIVNFNYTTDTQYSLSLLKNGTTYTADFDISTTAPHINLSKWFSLTTQYELYEPEEMKFLSIAKVLFDTLEPPKIIHNEFERFIINKDNKTFTHITDKELHTTYKITNSICQNDTTFTLSLLYKHIPYIAEFVLRKEYPYIYFKQNSRIIIQYELYKPFERHCIAGTIY